jgi:hypothetical protein
MQPQWNNTYFHGPKLVKMCLSVGINMREITLFKGYLRLTVIETVRR